MSADVKTLRRRLFGSHLLVMAVALGVVVVVLGIVVALFGIFGGHGGVGRQQESGPLGLVFGLAAAVVASALVSWRVTRRLAAPLEDISAATRELAAGRYGVRVPRADTAELNDVASDVNTLAAELESTEERRLRLIGDVAHELRNPLSTIEGTMEALLDGVVEAEPDTYARIGREAARLRRLADDLSSLSSAGELAVVASEAVDLAALASGVVSQLEPQATAKGLTLELERGAVPSIVGDADRLTQVLTNVVGNAVQYTESGSVRVRTFTDGRKAVVEVIDTGRGLSDENQRNVFERFYRVDAQYSDGTGVGLAIAKLIVEAHGGQISASSAGVGQGSTFRIELT